jgi:hypothetical protein
MTLNSSDYDDIRRRAEKRLEPLKRLWRLRLWFFLNVGLAFGAIALINSSRDSSIFWQVTTETGSYVNEITRQTESYSFTTYEIYPLVIFIQIVWFFLLIAHAMHIWSAYRHERAIQREVERETALELERLRLQVELARYGQRGDLYDADSDPDAQEKVKRTVRLSDDGELLSAESPQTARRRRG